MLDLSNYQAKSLKTESAILDMASKIGTGNLTDMSVFERFGTFMFAAGLAYKENKANFPVDTAKIFGAFNAPFRTGEGSLRKTLSDASIKSWASSFGAFFDAGRMPYDMTPVIEATLRLDKTSYTTRGARLRAIMKAHPTHAPTEAEANALLSPVAKPDVNPALTLANKLLGSVSDKRLAKNEPEAMAAIKDKARQRIALLAVRQALVQFVKACDVAEGETGMSLEEEMAALQAEISGGTPAPSVN